MCYSHADVRKCRYPLAGLFVLLLMFTVGSAAASTVANISDADITGHVKSEFAFDPAVSVKSVAVKTDRGIVTLTGNVNNILEKERAERIAETVRGVRSVINRINVNPVPGISADKLTSAVKNALLYDPAADSYEIAVSANGKGHVVLSGTVESWQERFLTETVAKGVRGVTAVTDNIIVNPARDRADREIRPEIEKRMHWDALVDDAMIDVNVNDGKVTLSGIVGSAAEKRRAETDAWVGGVKSIDSSGLKVEKWARDDSLRAKKYVARPDHEILKAVQDALYYDPRVSAFTIGLEVDNRRVTLLGTVDNIMARKAAERDAMNTVGVTGVRNMLKVRPGVTPDDKEILSSIRSALKRNPITESREITVSVEDSVVSLAGKVDTYYEKAEAENIVFHADGVTGVINNLEVKSPTVLIYDPYIYGWSIYDYPWYVIDITTAAGRNDMKIKEDIEEELAWSPFVNADDITVNVKRGIATLTGTVDSIRENEAAEENAFEGGAVSVINKLNIRLVSDPLMVGSN